MQLSLIVAAAENGVIADKDGGLPWHQPADVAYFRAMTKGHPVIMGRATYEAIGHALPDRPNIVTTHEPDFKAPGCTVVHSIDEALQAARTLAKAVDEIFIIGGAAIFDQTLPLANKIYLTRVHARPEGTVFFRYDPEQWTEISTERHQADDHNQYGYTFSVLMKN